MTAERNMAPPDLWNGTFVQGSSEPAPSNIQWGLAPDQQAVVEDSWTNAVRDLHASMPGHGYAATQLHPAHSLMLRAGHPLTLQAGPTHPIHAQLAQQALQAAGYPIGYTHGYAPPPIPAGHVTHDPHTGAELAPPPPMQPRTLSSYHRAWWLK